jgi:hypothetical protein
MIGTMCRVQSWLSWFRQAPLSTSRFARGLRGPSSWPAWTARGKLNVGITQLPRVPRDTRGLLVDEQFWNPSTPPEQQGRPGRLEPT